MKRQTTYHTTWIHVQLMGKANPDDVIGQVREPEFVTALQQKQNVIFDYSGAEHTQFSDTDMGKFVTLGEVLASLSESVELAIVPSSQQGREQAQRFKELVRLADWQVYVADSLSEAKRLLSVSQ